MRFWMKIGTLSFAMYLACYATFLVQDRREHHAVVREVEAVTRTVVLDDILNGRHAEAKAKLDAAKIRLDENEARWRCDAQHLWLISTAD